MHWLNCRARYHYTPKQLNTNYKNQQATQKSTGLIGAKKLFMYFLKYALEESWTWFYK